MSFLDLVLNYKNLLNNGYNKPFNLQSALDAINAFLFIFNDILAIYTYDEYIKEIRQH